MELRDWSVITGFYAQNDPANPRWITMLRPFMRAFINDVVLMENTVMQSNLIYTIMRPPFLTNGKFLFDKPPMRTRGGSRGRVRGCAPPPPEMTCGFLIQLLKKSWIRPCGRSWSWSRVLSPPTFVGEDCVTSAWEATL